MNENEAKNRCLPIRTEKKKNMEGEQKRERQKQTSGTNLVGRVPLGFLIPQGYKRNFTPPLTLYY